MKLNKVLGLSLVGAVMLCASCSDNNDEAVSYVSLRNDSEIAMLCNESGEVIDVQPVDENGEEVLDSIEDDNETLENKSAYDAAILFTEKSIELGFFDPQHGASTIYVGVVEDDESGSSNLEFNIESSLTDYFMNNQIKGTVGKDNVDIYASSASKWGVSSAKMKLINRAVDGNPALEISVAADMTTDELLDEIQKSMDEYKQIDREHRAEYKDAIEKLKKEYQEEIDLKEHIDLLLQRLECVTIDDDIKSAITIQLEALKARFDEAKYDQYKASIEAVKGEYIKISISAEK